MTNQIQTLSFNTGRKYAADGQPISAAFDPETGTVAFVDHARMIEGIIREMSSYFFTSGVVLGAYDTGRYELPRSADLPLLRAAHKALDLK